jgi:type IV pilus assembly protein PilO
MDALLTDINQAGLGRGLQFELFKPAANETMADFYAELPIQLKLSGGYHDFGAFATDISKLSRIVTLNDIALGAGKDGLIHGLRGQDISLPRSRRNRGAAQGR